MDPKIVDEPEQFKPERWIGDEPINARKGTPAEVLDSIMYRDPFSQGVSLTKCYEYMLINSNNMFTMYFINT